MGNPFITDDYFVSPSLNRVRVAAMPESGFCAELSGLNGNSLLSATALKTMVRARAGRLGLRANSPLDLPQFNLCFENRNRAVREAANQIARAYGQRLALLLLTLKKGERANRLARPSWGDEQWAFWNRVRRVYLGGGLIAGAFGVKAVAAAAQLLQQQLGDELTLARSPYGAYLPLAGLARMARDDSRAMLLLDFGHTQVKRAIVYSHGARGRALQPLPMVPLSGAPEAGKAAEQAYAAATREEIVDIVARTWAEAQTCARPLAARIGVSLACYLVNGHPPPSEMGRYGRLQLLADQVQADLGALIRARIGQDVHLDLVHDGTAAALAYAGERRTVVIMLGTSIGVGFVPQSANALKNAPVLCEEGGPGRRTC